MDSNLFWILALVVGFLAGYLVNRFLSKRNNEDIDKKVKETLGVAEVEARELVLDAKAKAAAIFDEVKREEVNRKEKLDKSEIHLMKREETLAEQSSRLMKNQEVLDLKMKDVEGLKGQVEVLKEEAKGALEKVAGMKAEDAKKLLLGRVEEEYKGDLLNYSNKFERELKDEAEKKTMDVITTALQRYARSHVSELTTSHFILPSEDMKGKIIGREGRNIRTLERLTGVDIVMDESPDSVTISSFDPLRRETARLTLEKLIKDGRIQPAKIEEKVEEAKVDLHKRILEYGEKAVFELGIIDFPKEIIQILGQLHFRTSYGQNVLAHSVEMAHIAGMIAGELGANVEVAKRGALVHDIGKAIDHEVEGTHIELGRKLLKKYNIDERVILAMEAHHDDYPHATPEAFIVTTADVLSGARPGARRDTVENYIKRLENLEKIASSYPGIKQSYAVSGGREIRIFVVPEKIDDFGALQLAKNIAGRIQTEMRYPGEIKVVVIRETRALEVAR